MSTLFGSSLGANGAPVTVKLHNAIKLLVLAEATPRVHGTRYLTQNDTKRHMFFHRGRSVNCAAPPSSTWQVRAVPLTTGHSSAKSAFLRNEPTVPSVKARNTCHKLPHFGHNLPPIATIEPQSGTLQT